MGGYGALIHGLAHPERYAAVGAFSPVTTIRRGKFGPYDALSGELRRKYEPEEILRTSSSLPPLYYSYGTEDYLLSCQDWFETIIEKMNITHEFRRREGFGHEWKLWDEEIEAFLSWLPRTDVCSKMERRSV